MTDWTKSTHGIDARGNKVRVEHVRVSTESEKQIFRLLDAAYLEKDKYIEPPLSLWFKNGVMRAFKEFKLIPPQEGWQHQEADKRVVDGDYRELAAALIVNYEQEPLEPAGVAYNSVRDGISNLPWKRLGKVMKDFYRDIYEAGKRDAFN